MRHGRQRRAALLGAIFGAFLGSILALLYHRWTSQRQEGERKPIQTRQIVRFGLSLIPLLRQFLKLIS